MKINQKMIADEMITMMTEHNIDPHTIVEALVFALDELADREGKQSMANGTHHGDHIIADVRHREEKKFFKANADKVQEIVEDLYQLNKIGSPMGRFRSGKSMKR